MWNSKSLQKSCLRNILGSTASREYRKPHKRVGSRSTAIHVSQLQGHSEQIQTLPFPSAEPQLPRTRPWKWPRPVWMGTGATWSSGRCGWVGWMVCKVHSNPNCSMVLCKHRQPLELLSITAPYLGLIHASNTFSVTAASFWISPYLKCPWDGRGPQQPLLARRLSLWRRHHEGAVRLPWTGKAVAIGHERTRQRWDPRSAGMFFLF